MDNVTVALPTGRLGKEVKELFIEKGIAKGFAGSRILEWTDADTGIRYMYVKPSDVITYVNKGVADIGIVGRDNILEENKEIYELFDLEIGACEMVIAGYPEAVIYGKEEPLVIATKYPNIAKRFFKSKKQEVEIVKLNGSVEIAPLVKLSDVIVDITQTGATLKENGLVVLDKINDVSARLIANRTSYRFKNNQVSEIVNKLKDWLDEDN